MPLCQRGVHVLMCMVLPVALELGLCAYESASPGVMRHVELRMRMEVRMEGEVKEVSAR